ncbi:hypothetical protein CFC35_35835 [Streptomyces sp. FBKL.4005]|uniref:hypothetical protein n=1 Tax=Streptomyces sp. FBKL.4005 TaxID=2015515 RepID=UPI000B96E505|nr:hypothetical protein [Streptomyces sp. FBKL.4005]MCE0445393.1 hypothetical protein [Streptomyces tricolor]OYP19197.1 hypothetical protein CFC35_35835 [Streptomyces sp. FBKL.4005]
MHVRTTALATIAVLAATLTACGSNEPSPSKAERATTANSLTPATPSTAAPKLSAAWVPKLEKATITDVQGVCTHVGSKQCADHLTDIVTVGIDLQQAITDAGAKRMYPRSTDELDKMMRASKGYTNDGCLNDPSADVDGSPCFKHSLDIMGAGANLQFTMETDEIRWGLDG